MHLKSSANKLLVVLIRICGADMDLLSANYPPNWNQCKLINWTDRPKPRKWRN